MSDTEPESNLVAGSRLPKHCAIVPICLQADSDDDIPQDCSTLESEGVGSESNREPESNPVAGPSRPKRCAILPVRLQADSKDDIPQECPTL